jgi:hypothetical protein
VVQLPSLRADVDPTNKRDVRALKDPNLFRHHAAKERSMHELPFPCGSGAGLHFFDGVMPVSPKGPKKAGVLMITGAIFQ